MGQQPSIQTEQPSRIRPVPGQYGVKIVRKNTICVYTKQKMYSLKVSPTTTIIQLVAMLPPSQGFKLYFEEKVLPLDATLQELGIAEASLLKLVEEDSGDSSSTATESSVSTVDAEPVTVRRLTSEKQEAEASWWDYDLSAYSVPDLRLEARKRKERRHHC